MSDQHDPNAPVRGTGHSHDHDHDPDHHQEHEHGEQHATAVLSPSQPPARPPATPPSPVMEVDEDAGTQALSDALKSSFAVVKVLMAGLVVVFLLSGFFSVGPQEKAVILRFGRPLHDARLLEPGPHWAFPPPIDEVVRIPVGQIQTVESSIGWYATTRAAELAGTENPPGESLNPVNDGYLITGDGNIVHLRATLRYRIAEPGLRYLLDFANSTNLVRHALNNALLYAAARYRVDDALTRDQAGFRELARARLEEMIARQDLGIVVDQIDNLRVIPPRQLKESFDRVLEAEVRRSKEMNDARTYENQTLSQARAEAEARKNAAGAQRTRLVEFVAAEVERFTNNLPAFRTNPDLFLQQRQTEVLVNVFTNAQDKLVAPQRGHGSSRTMWIQINREPPKPRTSQPRTTADQH